jgi:hypothetical protein
MKVISLNSLKENFWWSNMKEDIAKYVSECDTCQRIKASHLKPSGTLQPLPIPSWKWDDISMDFVSGLPLTSRKHDSIWVIVDRLTKTAHFIPVHTTYDAKIMQVFILSTLIACMVFLKPSFPIGDFSLWHVFGNSYISPLAQKSYVAQLIILKLMVKLKG